MFSKSNPFYRFLFAVLALVLVFSGLGAAAQPAAAAAPANCTQWHTVQSGEYLSKIARIYDVSWLWLADINDLANPSRIYPGQRLCVAVSGAVIPDTGSNVVNGTQLYILAVDEDYSVTVRAINFPARAEVQVLMDVIGTHAEDGYLAGVSYTDRNGVLQETFRIPSRLVDQSRIAIRVVAVSRPSSYAYNWFENRDGSGSGIIPDTGSNYKGLQIVRVVENKSVTFRANNLPANTRFAAYLEWQNRYGAYQSVWVENLTSDRNGTLSATLDQPEEVQYRNDLWLRLSSRSGKEYTARAWFENVTGEVYSNGSVSSSSGSPYLDIVSVNSDGTVTIKAYNFPARRILMVYMDEMGAQGRNGIEVAEVPANGRGVLNMTLDIPTELLNEPRIAVRVETRDGQSYAYNSFNPK